MRLLLFISCFGFALEFTQVLKDHEKDRNEQNRQGGGSCHAAKNRGATASPASTAIHSPIVQSRNMPIISKSLFACLISLCSFYKEF